MSAHEIEAILGRLAAGWSTGATAVCAHSFFGPIVWESCDMLLRVRAYCGHVWSDILSGGPQALGTSSTSTSIVRMVCACIAVA